jgi:hypothetical protein
VDSVRANGPILYNSGGLLLGDILRIPVSDVIGLRLNCGAVGAGLIAYRIFYDHLVFRSEEVH